MGQERRRHPRRNVRLPVQELQPESHLMCATSVSVGGLFFPDAVPRQRGIPVVLEIDVPGGGPPLRVTARIVHSGGGPDGMGVGVEFNSVQPQLLSVLRRKSA
jgi:hypothetical protein